MTDEQLKTKVQARMDELSPFTDTELNGTIDLISSMWYNAAQAFYLMIPANLITPMEMQEEGHSENQDGSGRWTLPDDFLRLYSFKMSSWERPVTEITPHGTTKYYQQFNQFTRGGTAKPVCIITHAKGSYKYLHYFSVDGSIEREIETKLYINYPTLSTLEETLESPFSWYLASEILQVIGEKEAASKALERMQIFIESLIK